MSDTITRGIRVTARSTYEPAQSSPAQGRWFFSYRIRIENIGDQTARLLSRLWIITDDHGKVSRVEGPGVIGETPTLDPGESFEYQSFCPLPTPSGTMEGHYVMAVPSTGERFDARVAPFGLAAPGAVN